MQKLFYYFLFLHLKLRGSQKSLLPLSTPVTPQLLENLYVAISWFFQMVQPISGSRRVGAGGYVYSCEF